MNIDNNKGGVELVAAIVIAVILAVVGAGIISLSYNHYKIVKQKSVDKERAYHFALGGIQKVAYEVQKGNSIYAVNDVIINTGDAGWATWEGLTPKENIKIEKIVKNGGSNPLDYEYKIEATVTY